ncbi:MAG: molybdenum cofactor guanylyltransferase [Pirellulales bacterium]|nr:molybdenum cofactor guanylyltransferase [Pirellulales bacterium]
MDQLAAIVLCGGESRRMGRPKAWLPLGDETLLGRVVRLAGEAAREVIVVAATGQDLPELPPQTKIVRDLVAQSGPLEGLRSGLRAVDPQLRAAFVTGVDYPFIDPRVIALLAARLAEHDVALPSVGGRLQPLVAVYARALLPRIESLLAQGERRLLALAEAATVAIVAEDDLRRVDPELACVVNVNNPAAYESARQRLSQWPPSGDNADGELAH